MIDSRDFSLKVAPSSGSVFGVLVVGFAMLCDILVVIRFGEFEGNVRSYSTIPIRYDDFDFALSEPYLTTTSAKCVISCRIPTT